MSLIGTEKDQFGKEINLLEMAEVKIMLIPVLCSLNLCSSGTLVRFRQIPDKASHK